MNRNVSALDISVAETLDFACALALDALHRGLPMSTLRVHSSVCRLVARAKARELARGEPLMLLGMPLVSDDSVVPGKAVIP